jgi:hypothetical protein
MLKIISTAPSIDRPWRWHRQCALVGLLWLGLLATAFGQHVDIDAVDGTDFAKFKTFSVTGSVHARAPILNRQGEVVTSEIVRALTAKGLTRADEAADLAVRFEFTTERKVDTRSSSAGPRGRGVRVTKTVKAAGTLIIDLEDTASKTQVWHAEVTEDERDAERLADRVDEMVGKAMAKYPPKKR